MIGSYAALRPAPSQAAYAASKAALAGLVKSLAREWGKGWDSRESGVAGGSADRRPCCGIA